MIYKVKPFLKDFFLVKHEDGLVGEAKVMLKEISKDLTNSSHFRILLAIVRIKEYFWPNHVVGAVKTQLLTEVGSSDFKVAIFWLCLVVHIRDVDVVIRDFVIGVEQVNDVLRKC